MNSLSIYRHASLFVAALSFLAAPTVSEAQEWPSKQVSVILPTAAGGSTDLMGTTRNGRASARGARWGRIEPSGRMSCAFAS